MGCAVLPSPPPRGLPEASACSSRRRARLRFLSIPMSLQLPARRLDEGGDPPRRLQRRWYGAKTRSGNTAVRLSTPIAFSVGLGPAVRDAQAEPAEASTPRASSACSSGSAGRPGNASEAMCGARGAAVTVGRAPATTLASAPSAACSKRSRSAATRSAAPSRTAARASVAARRTPPARAGSRCRRAGRAPGRRRPRAAPARPPGRSHSAPAPRGPCSLWAETATLSAPSRRAGGGAQANACTASTCRCGRLRSPPAQQTGDVGDRLLRAELVVDQHERDDRGIGAHGGRDSLGADDAVRARGHHIERPALARQGLGAAHDRRVLERAHHQVPPARGARRAQHAERVGLGAAAGEQHLRGLDVQGPRHLGAPPSPGRARPPRRLYARRRGWRRGPRRRRAVRPAPRARARRGGVVQVNHRRPLTIAVRAGSQLGRRRDP